MLMVLHPSTLRAALAVWSAIVAFGGFQAMAQKIIYADYPQKRGKVQPLEFKNLPSWMTLSGEIRGRTEGVTSWNYAEGNDRIFELTRIFGGVEVRPTRFATGYLQFMDTHALGLPIPSVVNNQRDVFDARQGYVDLHFRPKGVPVHLITGRQEIKFGSERIIGTGDFANNTRSWDGFVARIGSRNAVHLFSTSVVAIRPTSLDKHGAGLTFHGAYGDISSWIPKTHLSPYVLFRTVKGVTSQQGRKGNEVETTFGAEVEGTLPGNFDYVLNGNLQRGSYSNNSIHAGQALERISYSMPKVPWQPRIGYEYNYATGNTHRNPDRISTYDNQYPSNHNAFGLVDLFGYQNLTQKRLHLDLGPTQNLSILVQGGFLKLAAKQDAVYAANASVAVRPPAGGFTSDELGQEFDTSAKYVYRESLVANVGVGHFFPGKLMRDNQHGSAYTLAYFSLTYRFRVDKHKPGPTPVD